LIPIATPGYDMGTKTLMTVEQFVELSSRAAYAEDFELV
jgi:hypothetical protein